jgi:hypothetical protein
MTEFCYSECSPLDPPWESSIAAFFFTDDSSGWIFQTVWLNDASIWEDVYQVEFTSCR